MVKINMWLRRLSVPFLWGAATFIALAMVCSRIENWKLAADVLYIAAFAVSGMPILFRAVQGLRFKTVSIELLVSIASIGACFIGEFNESAIVTFLFQFGSFLEQKTMKKTRSAIKELTEMAPQTAWRMDESGEMEEIDADEIEVDDILLVKTGGQIASDGTVVSGEGYVMEASITGEPVPKYKGVGDSVYAGTILDSGNIRIKAAKVGEDTTFARIIALVEEAQDAKSPVERFIDRFARYYTPSVILIAVLVFIFTRDVDTAITVLVLACPGALVIGAPIANVAGIGRGAQSGILLKGGDSIHTFARTDTVVFDKTGTLTMGVPEVTAEKIYSLDAETTLLLAASAEKMSDHPLAQAVVRYADARKISGVYETESVQTVKGGGIIAEVAGHSVIAGSQRLMESKGIVLAEQVLQDLTAIQDAGASTVMVAIDGEIAMILGISDKIKDDAGQCMKSLKSLGIGQLIMLTGDNAVTAGKVAADIGVTDFRAELLPEDKMNVIRELQSEGRVVTFVGDGINDSPALATADTGIAMGSGTDAAIENSDVVLIKSDLESLVNSLKLSRRTVRILYENIIIAVGTVILLLVGLFAGYIHMAIGMLIHEASILVVIFNAMRLIVKGRCRVENN